LGDIAAPFITKLSAGGLLVYSTYLGDTNQNFAAVATDAGGDTVFVVGSAQLNTFPMVHPLQSATAGQHDALVARIVTTVPEVVSSILSGAGAACNAGLGAGIAYSGAPAGIFANPARQDWRSVLALLYGGLDDTSPGSNPDCASPARKLLIDNWKYLFQDSCSSAAACAGAPVNGALWRAFRLDDSSVASQVFASIIGLAVPPSATAVNGFGSSPYCNAMNWDTSTTNVNCSRGSNDQWVGPGGVVDPASKCVILGACGAPGTGNHRRPPPSTWGDNPDPSQGALGADVLPTQFQDNDPIRHPCIGGPTGVPGRPGEEVCNLDGALGVVLPIPESSWMAMLPTALPQYTVSPCTGFAFGRPPTVFTCAVRGAGTKHSGECPNGDRLFAGGCLVPVDTVHNTSSCEATKATVAAIQVLSLGNPDGRIYNVHVRDGTTGGTVPVGYAQYPVGSTGTTLDFVGGYSRIHEIETLIPGLPACRQSLMGAQIGCLVQADPCSIGIADQNAPVWNAPMTPSTGAVRVNQVMPGAPTYPL
jgi:hypothetical protein